VSIVLTALGAGLALVAMLSMPWTRLSDPYYTEYGLLPEYNNPIPDAVGVIAVFAVVVAIAAAVISRFAPLPRGVRVAAAAYDVLVAVLGLVGVAMLTDHGNDEPDVGSRMLAVALLMLAAVTLMRPVRRPKDAATPP
jgi:hypothetical protein